MKNILSLFALIIILFSCDKEVKKKTEPTKEVPLNERPIPPQPGATTTANSVVGGAHYICPNNDGGTSGEAGACSVCGTALAHNQGFHSTPSTSPAITNGANTSPSDTSGPNAKGVYHYTCSNGCAGGSGAAGNCTTCGNTLEHNQAFHS